MSESPANNMIGARSGDAPDLIEPVIGYRMWAVEHGELVAPFQRDITDHSMTRRFWGPGTQKAECHIKHVAEHGLRLEEEQAALRAGALANASTGLEKMLVIGGSLLTNALSKQLIVAGRREFWKSALARPAHQAPYADCECGIYAYHRLEQVFNRQHFLGALMTSMHERLPLVVGAAQLWGKLEIHQSGIRAEYAKPIMFIEHSMANPIITLEIGKRYGIEVATQAGYRSRIDSYGTSSEKLYSEPGDTQ